jgi:hypothetical protein
VRLGADRDLLELVDSHSARSSQTLDDDLRAHPLLHVLFDFFQDLAGQNHDRGGAVAHLGVLATRYVD